MESSGPPLRRQRTSFSELRSSGRRGRLHRDIYWGVVRIYAIYLAVFSLIYLKAYNDGLYAEKQNNYYSINHTKYLKLYFGIQIRVYCALISGMLTFNNFGFKFRNCFDGLLFVILSTFRAMLVGYVLFIIYPMIFEWFGMTWNLNTMNWWQYPDEPWVTNCCPVSAVYTNIIWFFSMIFIYVYVFFGGFVLLIILAT